MINREVGRVNGENGPYVVAYLDTRLFPHVMFAVLLPWLIVCVFGAGAVALLAGLWGVSHVAEVDGRQRRDLERRGGAR